MFESDYVKLKHLCICYDQVRREENTYVLMYVVDNHVRFLN